MLDNVERQSEQVVDARGAGRFAGSEAEPRQGLRSGHIPQSVNVPFTQACRNPTHDTTLLILSDVCFQPPMRSKQYRHACVCCMTWCYPSSILTGLLVSSSLFGLGR